MPVSVATSPLTTCKLIVCVLLSLADAGYLPLLGVEQTDCSFGAGSSQCQNCSDALPPCFVGLRLSQLTFQLNAHRVPYQQHAVNHKTQTLPRV
jgi:hypothetical protein